MRSRIRGSLLATLLSAAATLVVAAAATAAPAPVVGHLYINDNTAPGNTIAGFARHSDGTLTALGGSPFATGGGGTGAGIGSQGALQSAANGRYLLAVDPGSNQVSVLRVGEGGALTVADVVSSGGIQPVSIAVHGAVVYVANSGTGGSNYTGFHLTAEGKLVAIPDSTFPLPDGSDPGDILFNPTGTHLAATRVGPALIDSFDVSASGRLTAAPGSPFAAQGPGPFGSEFSPTAGDQLFVSNAHGGPNAGTISAFHVTGAGVLQSIGNSPFADFQTAPCWVEITHNGRILFTVNTGSASISSYSIAPGGTLSLITSTALRNGSGLSPFDARLAPDGRTLWVVDDSGAVSGLAVHGGHLTELASSPTSAPAGSHPFGIVVN